MLAVEEWVRKGDLRYEINTSCLSPCSHNGLVRVRAPNTDLYNHRVVGVNYNWYVKPFN